MKSRKRRSWTTADVRTMKSLARKKIGAGKIVKKLGLSRSCLTPSSYQIATPAAAFIRRMPFANSPVKL